MRIALLTAQSLNSDGDLIAGVMLAGRSVIEWQIEIAHKLGCERVICLADSVRPELLAAQHFAEARSLEFMTVKGPLPLTALMTAGNEVLLLQEGLWLDSSKLSETLTTGPIIAAIADQAGAISTERLERIDRERLWAGYAIIPSRFVAKLSDFPADSDCVSLLLRLALQARIASVVVDQQEQMAMGLQFVDSAEGIGELERSLLKDVFEQSAWLAPTQFLAGRLVERAIRTRMVANRDFVATTAVLSLLGGLALAIWGMPIASICAALTGALLLAVFTAQRDHKVLVLGEAISSVDRPIVFGHDLLLAATLCVIASQTSLTPLPIFVIGLIVLAERLDSSPLQPFWRDRALHLAGLGLALVFGQLHTAMTALGLVALIMLLAGQIRSR